MYCQTFKVSRLLYDSLFPPFLFLFIIIWAGVGEGGGGVGGRDVPYDSIMRNKETEKIQVIADESYSTTLR